MKSIGIIRRMDELGRIVIPKEIRKKLKINETEPLEVFVEDDKIIIKKHNEIDNNLNIINKYGEIIRDITNKNVIITNKQNIIYCNKSIKDTFYNKEITEEIISIINDRKIKEGQLLEVIKNIKLENYICNPIILNSDSIGLIIIFSDENITKEDKIIMEIVTKILNVCLE